MLLIHRYQIRKLTTSMGLASFTGRLEIENTCTHMPLGWKSTLHAGQSCPCAAGPVPRAFVGSDYYCESGNNKTTFDGTTFYNADVLWDGQLCRHDEVTCCDPPILPWFCRNFTNPITEDMEIRICLDEGTDNENVALEFFELYILGEYWSKS